MPSIINTKEFHKSFNPTFTCISRDISMVESLHTSNNNNNTINKTLHKYLNTLKSHIDECFTAWDKYKKYTNPYEFIHTIVPNTRSSICTYKPLSRSFFKMIEMCKMMNILDELPKDKCKSFHLAEGPGGFIEALVYMRKNPNDSYIGMTLIEDNNKNVPGWRKSKYFLDKNTNVYIEKGVDGTGDLLNPHNLIYCFKNYKNSFDLITGDGGIDFSVHYQSQETVSSMLIICQVSFAIATQIVGGTLILKMFDTFTKLSVDIIYLLSNVYESVNFVKPSTSRYANSEKYLICKNFRLDDKSRGEIINILYRVILHVHVNKQDIESLFNAELPYYFISKVEECNAIFGQQQLENINITLNLIDNNKYDKLELIKKHNIQKCINWCQQYNMEYNSSIQPNNIFLSNRVISEDIIPRVSVPIYSFSRC
jgi:23S rRNA U2552 (ribose-2'-O)-methylase RlmE/FtsJ